MQPRDHVVAAPARKAARSGTHRVAVGLQQAVDARAPAHDSGAYRELFEGAPLAYLVTDAKGVITRVNQKACVLFNAGERVLVGKTLASLVARADRARLRDLIELMTELVLHAELRVQPRGGETAWVAVVAQCATSQDEGACIRWLMRSAHVQKQEDARRAAEAASLEARILELEAHGRRVGHFLKREQDARRAAEERAHGRERALAQLAHDLAGPLRTLEGWSQLIDQEPLDLRARKQAAASIRRGVRDLLRIAEDLRDHARIEAHQPMLETVPIDLVSVIADTMAELRVLAVAKRIHVELAATSYHLPMRGDPLRLRQAFGSLLDNAIKLTPEDGHVRVAVSVAQRHADVVVSDSGPGIARESFATLFEPFARARVPQARTDGLGLGLSIARRLIELHGGTIEADTGVVLQGASFRVRLPILDE